MKVVAFLSLSRLDYVINRIIETCLFLITNNSLDKAHNLLANAHKSSIYSYSSNANKTQALTYVFVFLDVMIVRI